MSRILLDTHLLLWALGEPKKLPPQVRRWIDEAEVFVSAASIWEVSIKTALGKLTADPAQLLAEIEPAGFQLPPLILLTKDSTLGGYVDFVQLVAASSRRR